MRYLLDTHAFLWWNEDDPRVSRRARAIMEDGDHDVLLSVASAWEMAIKSARGDLRLPMSLDRYLTERIRVLGLTPLPIALAHALTVGSLPALHRDPYDRMLVAQALVEGVPILTADRDIARYPVEVIW